MRSYFLIGVYLIFYGFFFKKMKMRLFITIIVIAPCLMISPIFNLSFEEVRAVVGLSLLLLFGAYFSFVTMVVLIKVGLHSVYGWSSSSLDNLSLFQYRFRD